MKNQIASHFKPDQFVGKIVATRGIGSGIHVGKLLFIDGQTAILADAYFMGSWTYKNSCGSFHSFTQADLTGGTSIVHVHGDSIIADIAQIVVCPDELMDLCRKFATVK